MQITNMQSSAGNPVPNQFIITLDNGTKVFQSYSTVIAAMEPGKPIELSSAAYDYSQTTTKYLKLFLGWGKAETQKRMNDGWIIEVEPEELAELV